MRFLRLFYQCAPRRRNGAAEGQAEPALFKQLRRRQRTGVKALFIKARPGEAPNPERDHMASCPVHKLRNRLRDAGLRPTRQRVALGWLLFGKGHRHVTAERLYEEAALARVPLSLATVYNTLNQFTHVGLLREIAVDGSRTYFDTNATHHHHFLLEDSDDLIDIGGGQISLSALPEPPEGMEIVRIDVVVRVRKKANA